MSNYYILDHTISDNDPNFQTYLQKTYGSNNRPLCMCYSKGVPMYIAKVNHQFIIKRMPNTGKLHHFNCPSYEPPEELSGRGQLDDTVIKENPEDGITALKLGFALTKRPGKQIAIVEATEKDTVKTDGTKLTLRSTLHYLWDQAGFNRYTPNMAGKRNWFVIRKYLLEAITNKITKGKSLASLVYIPELFNLDHKAEISQRRMACFNTIATAKKNKSLMIVIAPVKELSPARYGYQIKFKQIPDCPFMLNEDLFKRLNNRFKNELDMWNSLENSHLMAIATFGVNQSGTPIIEEISLMNVSSNWIPFENQFEYQLLDKLVTEQRTFIKGLRYNMPATKPMASAVLSDTIDKPTALYIESTKDQTDQLSELIASSDLNSWRWPIDDVMPVLPNNNF